MTQSENRRIQSSRNASVLRSSVDGDWNRESLLIAGINPSINPPRLSDGNIGQPFLFAQRSWQTPSLLDSDLTRFIGKRIRLARASAANAGVFGDQSSDEASKGRTGEGEVLRRSQNCIGYAPVCQDDSLGRGHPSSYAISNCSTTTQTSSCPESPLARRGCRPIRRWQA